MKLKSKFLFSVLASLFLTACVYEPYNQGKQLYEMHCANCHSSDGTGLEALIPDIRNSTYYTLKKSEFACIIKQGIMSTDSSLIMDMPPADKLSSFEISNIINYVNHKWNENFQEINILEIESNLNTCQKE